MRKELSYRFDILTPMFSAGADPQWLAEIRATEIRGELRWWLRALGGFKNDRRPIVEQEAFYFGSVHGGCSKSHVAVRVATSSKLEQNVQFGADVGTPLGYLLFPLRSNDKKGVYSGRAFFKPNDLKSEAFSVTVLINGSEEEADNINALLSVFGQFGAIGFRSRRCMGAIGFHGSEPMQLSSAIAHFSKPGNVVIKQLDGLFDDWRKCVDCQSRWLQGWRSHGRTSMGLSGGPGFKYAKIDHDAGFDSQVKTTYRPAIGLPIIQQYSSGGKIINEWDGDGFARFASPVILRPYRGADGKIRPVVIFADVYAWNERRNAKIVDKKKSTERTVQVSLDLYNAMKSDGALKDLQQ